MKTVDLNPLSSLLEQQNDISAALVFGSAQDGTIRPGSDIDIAILFKSKPNPDRLYTLMADITTVLGFDKVDLVTLNDSNCILAFEALNGKRLCVNDPSHLAEYSSLVAREYEDTMAQIAYQQQLRRTG